MNEKNEDLEEKAATLLEGLAKFYNPKLPDGEDDLLSVLIRSLLSQATNSANRNRAFSNLLATFEGNWNTVRQAESEDIEDAIKMGGLAKQKSLRIKALLEKTFEDFGECSLESIKTLSMEEAWDYLKIFKGIGPQSASLSLMLGSHADICPVNTDVLRVLKRVGILTNESGPKAHQKVNSIFPKGRLKETHYCLIHHGRKHCLSRNPICENCPIEEMCAF